MEQKEHNPFTGNNMMYSGKASKNVNMPLYVSLFTFVIMIFCALIFYTDTNNYEHGQEVRLNTLLWLIYDVFGKTGGTIFLIIFSFFLIYLGIKESMKLRKLRDEKLPENKI